MHFRATNDLYMCMCASVEKHIYDNSSIKTNLCYILNIKNYNTDGKIGILKFYLLK